MNKAQLRQKYKALRQQLTEEQIDQFSIDIANQLLKLAIWDYNVYHLFLTIESQKEIQTEFILNILSGKDKNIAISKSNLDSKSHRIHDIAILHSNFLHKYILHHFQDHVGVNQLENAKSIFE